MKMRYSLVLLACVMPQWSVTFTVNDMHYIWLGNYYQFAQNPQVAYQWFKKSLGDEQKPGYMYKGLLHLLQQTNGNNQIVSLMPSIEPSFAHDTETQLLFAQALQQAGYQNAADQKFIRLLDKTKDNQQVAFHAAQVFMRRKEPENALLTIQDYLTSVPGNPSNFMFHVLEAQAYLSMNNRQKAIASLEKSLELQPNFDKAWLILAQLHEQEGQLKKAITEYTTFLELSDSSSPEIQKHILQLAFKQKLLEAQEQHLHINTACFDQASALFKAHKYKEALQAIDKCLIQQPKDADTKILKMQALNAPCFIDTQALMCYKQQNRLGESLVLKHLAKCYST